MPLYGVSRDSFGGVTAAVPSAPILLDNVEAFYRRKFKDIYLELLAALKKAGMHSEISRVVKAKDFLNDIRIKNDDDKLEDIPPGLVKQIQTADDVLWFLLCHSNPCVGYAGEAPVDKGDEKLASDRHKTETAISGLMKKITEQAASPNASSQLKLFLIFYNLRDAFIRADELLKTLKQVKESGSLSTPGADESFKSQKEAVLLSVREHLSNAKAIQDSNVNTSAISAACKEMEKVLKNYELAFSACLSSAVRSPESLSPKRKTTVTTIITTPPTAATVASSPATAAPEAKRVAAALNAHKERFTATKQRIINEPVVRTQSKVALMAGKHSVKNPEFISGKDKQAAAFLKKEGFRPSGDQKRAVEPKNTIETKIPVVKKRFSPLPGVGETRTFVEKQAQIQLDIKELIAKNAVNGLSDPDIKTFCKLPLAAKLIFFRNATQLPEKIIDSVASIAVGRLVEAINANDEKIIVGIEQLLESAPVDNLRAIASKFKPVFMAYFDSQKRMNRFVKLQVLTQLRNGKGEILSFLPREVFDGLDDKLCEALNGPDKQRVIDLIDQLLKGDSARLDDLATKLPKAFAARLRAALLRDEKYSANSASSSLDPAVATASPSSAAAGVALVTAGAVDTKHVSGCSTAGAATVDSTKTIQDGLAPPPHPTEIKTEDKSLSIQVAASEVIQAVDDTVKVFSPADIKPAHYHQALINITNAISIQINFAPCFEDLSNAETGFLNRVEKLVVDSKKDCDAYLHAQPLQFNLRQQQADYNTLLSAQAEYLKNTSRLVAQSNRVTYPPNYFDNLQNAIRSSLAEIKRIKIDLDQKLNADPKMQALRGRYERLKCAQINLLQKVTVLQKNAIFNTCDWGVDNAQTRLVQAMQEKTYVAHDEHHMDVRSGEDLLDEGDHRGFSQSTKDAEQDRLHEIQKAAVTVLDLDAQQHRLVNLTRWWGGIDLSSVNKTLLKGLAYTVSAVKSAIGLMRGEGLSIGKKQATSRWRAGIDLNTIKIDFGGAAEQRGAKLLGHAIKVEKDLKNRKDEVSHVPAEQLIKYMNELDFDHLLLFLADNRGFYQHFIQHPEMFSARFAEYPERAREFLLNHVSANDLARLIFSEDKLNPDAKTYTNLILANKALCEKLVTVSDPNQRTLLFTSRLLDNASTDIAKAVLNVKITKSGSDFYCGNIKLEPLFFAILGSYFSNHDAGEQNKLIFDKANPRLRGEANFARLCEGSPRRVDAQAVVSAANDLVSVVADNANKVQLR